VLEHIRNNANGGGFMRKKWFIHLAWLLAIIMAICLISGCSNQEAEKDSIPAVSDNSVVDEADSDTDEPDNSQEEVPGENSPVAESGEDNNEAAGNVEKPEKDLPGKSDNHDTVTLMITKDFGSQTLVEKKVQIQKNWSIFELLESTVKIEGKWDGGFVNSINGLESQSGGFTRDGFDWFYYINGIGADVGADQYSLRAGEVIWWDYHVWKTMGSSNSAVIGCYPQPFIHGYRGKIGATNILAAKESTKMAQDLKNSLLNRGVRSINVKEMDNNLLENRSVPTIVVGTWSELKGLSWLDKFNQAYRKTGISVYFSDKGLELLDYTGKTVQTVQNSAGVIAAAGSGLGDNSPLWLVSGTDQEGLKLAVNLLVNNPQKISKYYSAVIAADKIYRLPLK
jgi:hypothetical protein